MSTISIIYVGAYDDAPRGVFHRYDSHPWTLGNIILRRALELGGDLDALAREIVNEAPHGWQFLGDRSRRETSSDPAFWTLADLRTEASIAWVYFIDSAAQTLSVFEDNPWFEEGASATPPTPWRVVVFGPLGEGRPPVFESADHDLFGVPAARLDDAPRHGSTRKTAIDRVLGDSADIVFSTAMRLLQDELAGVEWNPPDVDETDEEVWLLERYGLPRRAAPQLKVEGPLFVSFGPLRADSVHGTLLCGQLELRFVAWPEPLQTDFAAFAVRPDGYWARLEALFEFERASSDAAKLFHLAVAYATHGPREFSVDGGRLRAGALVVDRVLDPAVEIDIQTVRGAAATARVGDSVWRSVLHQPHRTMLEWLEREQSRHLSTDGPGPRAGG